MSKRQQRKQARKQERKSTFDAVKAQKKEAKAQNAQVTQAEKDAAFESLPEEDKMRILWVREDRRKVRSRCAHLFLSILGDLPLPLSGTFVIGNLIWKRSRYSCNIRSWCDLHTCGLRQLKQRRACDRFHSMLGNSYPRHKDTASHFAARFPVMQMQILQPAQSCSKAAAWITKPMLWVITVPDPTSNLGFT